MMKQRENRFKELKRERNRWWKKVVPRNYDGEQTAPAFYLPHDGEVRKVRVYIDERYNHKRVVGKAKDPYLPSSRTWPTREGALLDRVMRAHRLVDRRKRELDEAKGLLAEALRKLPLGQ